LNTNKYLKKLDISRIKVGKPGMLVLASALQNNTTLQTVTLRAADITPVIFQDFLQSLESKNITLKRVEIGENGKTSLSEWRALSAKANMHFQFFL